MRKPNDLTRILQLGMMVALPIALAACAPDDGDDLDTMEDSVSTTPAMESTPVEPVTVDLGSVDSEVDGEATISRAGESLMVSLTLDNLAGEGPFRGQIVSGRCEDRENQVGNRTDAPAPGTTPPAGTAPGTTPGATTPQTPASADDMNQGQVLASLEPIQMSGATTTTPGGQPSGQAPSAADQSGMSHSTIPVTDFRSMREAFIEIQGQASRTVACGNIDNLDRLLAGTAGTTTTPMTPGASPGTSAPGTQPATPPRP
jgi:hypothetical protein